MLYFAAGRLSADLEGGDISDALVIVAFQAFRREPAEADRFVPKGPMPARFFFQGRA